MGVGVATWFLTPPAPCVVPQVSQGRVILVSRNDTAPTSTVVPDGEELTVDCEPSYEFFASHQPVVCNNGTWTHIPKCHPARYARRPTFSAPCLAHSSTPAFQVQASAQVAEERHDHRAQDGARNEGAVQVQGRIRAEGIPAHRVLLRELDRGATLLPGR